MRYWDVGGGRGQEIEGCRGFFGEGCLGVEEKAASYLCAECGRRGWVLLKYDVAPQLSWRLRNVEESRSAEHSPGYYINH